jgi:hypothetical protein
MTTIASPTNGGAKSASVLDEAVQNLGSKELKNLEKGFEAEEVSNRTLVDEVNGAIPAGLESIPLVRFSSDRQRKGYSNERQIALVRRSAAELGWTVNETLKMEDLGVSGFRIDKKTGRPLNMSPDAALGAFMAAVDEGLIDVRGKVIHAEAVDRFTRACLDTAESAFWGLVRRGVCFYFINDALFIRPSDKDSPLKKIILILKFDEANRMVQALSRRQKDTLALKLVHTLKGQKLNWGTWMPSWINFVKEPQPHFEWEHQKYKTLMRLVDGVMNNKPLNAIARELNENKVPCFVWGKAWRAAGVRVILKNPALLGTFRFLDHVAKDYYPAAVTPEVWARLQLRVAITHKRGGGTARGRYLASLFPRLVKCAHCGRTMHAHRPENAPFTQRVYICRSHEDHGAGDSGKVCATGQRIYIDPIEQDFFILVMNQSPAQLLLKKDQQRQVQLDAARAEQVNLSQQIERLVRIAKTYPNLDEVEKELQPLSAKRQTLTNEIKKLDEVQKLTGGVDSAWNSIIKALKEAGSVDGINDTQLRDLLSAGKTLQQQLRDQEVRRKLLGPIQALVTCVEVDGSGCRYRVHSVTGHVGEWRDVSAGVASLRELHAAARLTEESRKRQSQARSEWWRRTGGISAEGIAAGVAKRAAKLAQRSAEQKRVTREKQSLALKRHFQSLAPEQRRLIREKQRAVMRSRSPEQLKQWVAAMSEKARQTRANWTPKKRKAFSTKMSAVRRAYYANMSPEQWQAFCAQRRAQAAARVARQRVEHSGQ